MEAKNIYHCSKKRRSNIDLMILGNYESSSSSQPVRTLISRFPFFGEFLPAGEIWTNTSQSTKSTLNKKKCGESVFLSKSRTNIQKNLKCRELNFWCSIYILWVLIEYLWKWGKRFAMCNHLHAQLLPVIEIFSERQNIFDGCWNMDKQIPVG